MKLAARAQARANAKAKAAGVDEKRTDMQLLEEYINEGSPDDVLSDEEEVTLEVGKSVCSVGLGHADLKHMINGFAHDPLPLRPFFIVSLT